MDRSSRLAVATVFVACTVVGTAAAIAIAPGPEGSPEIAIGNLGTGPTTTTTATTLAAPTTTAPGPVPTTTSAAASKAVLLAPGPHAPILSKIPTTDPVVFLTIDDGLVQDDAVIRYLESHDVPVTIFPTPPFVSQNPTYFDALHALGGSVQDHTVNHKNLTNLSAGEQQREICDVLPQFAARFGQTPWMLRPPGGAVNTSVQYAARTCGIRAIVLWRATMNDGRLDAQGGTLQAGDIVLLHFRDDLVHNLEVVVAAAKAQGLRPARLEDYLTPG